MSLLRSLKRGDRWPALTHTIVDTIRRPLPDITGAQAALLVRTHGTTNASTQLPGVVTLARVGRRLTLSYAWAEGETSALVDWDAEFEITLASGARWTVPGTDANGAPLCLRIQIIADLGDSSLVPTPPEDDVETVGVWVSEYPGVYP
jgi:hypothetical protein